MPDGGLHRPGAGGVWHPTAALVIEIVSPGDDTWKKLPFYAAHDVDELLIIDPPERSVSWLGLNGGEYRPIERSGLIDLGRDQLARADRLAAGWNRAGPPAPHAQPRPVASRPAGRSLFPL